MEFALGPKAREAGYRLEVHQTVGSTNAMALERARAGDPGPLWIVSPHQTSGRGRRGRRWETQAGNLAASLFLVLDGAPQQASTLSFAAGLALYEALAPVMPDGRRLRLKWPNDLLADGAKLAGILLEAERLSDSRLGLVIGIGVNVVEAPGGLPYRATALADLGLRLKANDLFGLLSESWTEILSLWDAGRGFSTIRALWLDRAAGLGEEVTVNLGGEVFRGVFETLDQDGCLIVRNPDGTCRTVGAGDVHFGVGAFSAS